MYKKIINIFYIVFFITFIIFITLYYFSENNIRNTNKSRSLYSNDVIKNLKNLPILKSDTNNITEYKNDLQINKKKKYYNFYKLFNKDTKWNVKQLYLE